MAGEVPTDGTPGDAVAVNRAVVLGGDTKPDDAACEDTDACGLGYKVVASWTNMVSVGGTQPKLTPALTPLTPTSAPALQGLEPPSKPVTVYPEGMYIVLAVRYNTTRIEQDAELDAVISAGLIDVWAKTPITAKSNRRINRLILEE